MDIPERAKEVWNDAVASKGISALIVVAFGGVASWLLAYLKDPLWNRIILTGQIAVVVLSVVALIGVLRGWWSFKPTKGTQSKSDETEAVPSKAGINIHQSPAQSVSAAPGAVVSQSVHYNFPPAPGPGEDGSLRGATISEVHLKFHELLRIACENGDDLKSASNDADSIRIRHRHLLTDGFDEYLQGLRAKVLATDREDQLLKNQNFRLSVEPTVFIDRFQKLSDARLQLYGEFEPLAARIRELRESGEPIVNLTKRRQSSIDEESARIRGSVREVYQVTYGKFTTTLIIYASIVNDSATVSPTIKCFICRLHMGGGITEGVLSGEASDPQPISGLARSSENETRFDRGPFPNLCQLNSSPLVKHNHREGWLKFGINGFDPSPNSMLSVVAVDGADNEHLIGQCSYPWPQQDGVHFVEYLV
jgi:hypothetical protein